MDVSINTEHRVPTWVLTNNLCWHFLFFELINIIKVQNQMNNVGEEGAVLTGILMEINRA